MYTKPGPNGGLQVSRSMVLPYYFPCSLTNQLFSQIQNLILTFLKVPSCYFPCNESAPTTRVDLDFIQLKSLKITKSLPTKVRLVKVMVFPVVMYGCESWTVKKAERQRTDAFELWCWRRLLRVPWTARRSNQSILLHSDEDPSVLGVLWKE